MNAKKILGIGTLAAAALFSTSGYTADTYIESKNKKLAQFSENSNYELLISAPWCGTCNLLKENMRTLGDEPRAEIQIQTNTDLYELRREFRQQGIDLPRGIPIMVDKVDGEVTVYYGFGREENKPVMYEWDGFRRSPTDKRVLLEKILE